MQIEHVYGTRRPRRVAQIFPTVDPAMVKSGYLPDSNIMIFRKPCLLMIPRIVAFSRRGLYHWFLPACHEHVSRLKSILKLFNALLSRLSLDKQTPSQLPGSFSTVGKRCVKLINLATEVLVEVFKLLAWKDALRVRVVRCCFMYCKIRNLPNILSNVLDL